MSILVDDMIEALCDLPSGKGVGCVITETQREWRFLIDPRLIKTNRYSGSHITLHRGPTIHFSTYRSYANLEGIGFDYSVVLARTVSDDLVFAIQAMTVNGTITGIYQHGG